MYKNYRTLMNIVFSISIVIMTMLIVYQFIPSIIWALIIQVSTNPIYKYWKNIFNSHSNVSSFLFTCIVIIFLLLPISYIINILIKEFQLFINYIHDINNIVFYPPTILHKIPIIGNDLIYYWNHHLRSTIYIKKFLSNLNFSLFQTSYYIKKISYSLFHKGLQICFTIFALFFLYRDGNELFVQINTFGKYCLGNRWTIYSNRLSPSLRAIVNGTILVGIGVGFLMGLCYFLVGFPAPTVTGFITAFSSMIPFFVPIIFIIISFILLIHSSIIHAIIVIIWGTIVMFIADHFIKPAIIGGTIKLPFLSVLFGILGGIKTMGLLGLFLGPIIMVLFTTLWYEILEIIQNDNI